MDTFMQPALVGYRQLNEHEAELMNQIKQKAVEIGEMVARLRATPQLD